MQQAIEKRELMEVEVLGVRLRGTLHRPAQSHSSRPPAGGNQERIAVLFLNSLALPRAATGDSAVYWADAVAERGYPAYRFDLPGLGDSDGETTTGLLDFINSGGYAEIAAALTKELSARGHLSGVVIAGHCAGSVSALYAAAGCRQCSGLVLMDPYFHLPVAKRPRTRELFSDWVRRSAVGKILSHLYDRVRQFRLLLRGDALPSNANTALLKRWKHVAATGLPILMFKAPGIKATASKPRIGEFDYLKHVLKLAGRRSRVQIKTLEVADHSFANRVGREAVCLGIESWLLTNFPLEDLATTAVPASPSSFGCKQGNSTMTLRPPSNRDCALEGR
jgi:pimeloyl-ACP methyl ester carboxylesterase